MMIDYVNSACSAIGGFNPEGFIVPDGMRCFIVPPPNGKNALAYCANLEKNAQLYIGMRHLQADIIKNITLYPSDFTNLLIELENYHECIVTTSDNAFIGYLEYWEDLSIIFIRYPANDFVDMNLRQFSDGWREYLESIRKLSNANVPLLNRLLALSNS